MPRRINISFDWFLWFQWVMATTLGWFLGGVLLPGIGLIPSGIGIGFFQWMVLNRRIHKAWRWSLVTAIGWSAGWAISLVAVPSGFYFFTGMLLGAATGMAQWLILRRELYWSGWWILVSAVGWSSGLTLLPGIMLSGMMAGVVTGIALELLLRYPKPLKDGAETNKPVLHAGRN